MKVTSRDGERFEAELVARGRYAYVLALEGRVRGGQVAAKVTRIIKGPWPGGTSDDLWTGALKGDELILKHTNKQNLVTTATLKRDRNAESPKDRPHGKRRKET